MKILSSRICKTPLKLIIRYNINAVFSAAFLIIIT